jgi:tetratricopeptide (TPR) repeat protein
MFAESVIESKVRVATDALAKLTGDDDEDYSNKQLAVTLLSSAASEYAEESRWDSASKLVKLLLPHIEVIKKTKRKAMYNFAAIVLLYVGDMECIDCQEEAIRLYMREMEFKKAAREAESFANVLLEREDDKNALKFFLRAADIMERDDRKDEAFLLRVMKITRLQVKMELFGEAADMAERLTANAPQLDESSSAELLSLSVLLRFLDLIKRGQDFGELRTNLCMIKLAENFPEKYAQIQNLVNAVQAGNAGIMEKNLACMQNDEHGIINAVKKWTMSMI